VEENAADKQMWQELTQKELILTQGAKVLSSAPVTASLTACISEIGLATKIRDTEERAGQRGFSTSADIIEDSCRVTGHGTTQ
jgi:hypothetical protein